MLRDDEPVLPRHPGKKGPKSKNTESLKDSIKKLVMNQPFAVLCTQGDGQPYGSLIAFAFTDDLKTAVFATPIATRKYRLLKECGQIALLIDNRPDFSNNMMQVEALTVTGRASQILSGPDYDRCLQLLVGRHAYLKKFAASESSALFEVKTTRFLHVTRFQEVNQWVPADK